MLSIGIVIWTVFQSQRSAFIDTMSLDPDAVPELILTIAMRLLMAVCVVTILLLAVDLLWVRMHWRKDIRMSKQEIKDEMKELEGDPLKKARLRSLALDRRRSSIIAAVPSVLSRKYRLLSVLQLICRRDHLDGATNQALTGRTGGSGGFAASVAGKDEHGARARAGRDYSSTA